MACYHPLQGWLGSDRKVRFGDRIKGERIELPCGRCSGCRLDRSRAWAVRCMQEASLHEENVFVTLTYDEKYLPRQPTTLCHRDVQLFLKRLRKKRGRFRYYMCGEYGDENWRPHYHALLFGMDFPDRQLFKESHGVRAYVSEELERLWQKGFCTIGDVTFESAAYCARYVMKKVSGEHAPFYYSELDFDTGELVPISPEYSRMSLRRGIGADWFERFPGDVYPDDFCVVGGKKFQVPRYYDKLFEKVEPERMLAIKEKRIERAKLRESENTTARLRVREAVHEAKISQLKRSL